MSIAYRGRIFLRIHHRTGDVDHVAARARVPLDVESGVARARVLLSLIAILTLLVDALAPSVVLWLPRGRGELVAAWCAAACVAHLLYSVALLRRQRDGTFSPALVRAATCGDVLFAALFALVTEGLTSPFYSFFAFAVLAAGMRSGLRSAMLVTVVGVALDAALIGASLPASQTLFALMRATDLAITGSLIGYLGQGRIDQETRIRSLEQRSQREQIARSLHDGQVQALAAVSWRIDACRELLRTGRRDDAERELAALQTGVDREHDELRGYIRSLVDLDGRWSVAAAPDDATQVSVHAKFHGSTLLVEHVLSILLEATRNLRRHARARSALLRAHSAAGELAVTIDDDGVGFAAGAHPPWSIPSRVNECGGRLTLVDEEMDGAHLRIRLPEG
jgi:signal transduction histidine kinase